MCDRAPLLVVMGVSGSGKSTLAQALAARLGCPMLEGDSLHSPASIAKMSAGVPLTDADRHDWLDAIGERLEAAADAGSGLVATCSALTRRYRDVLRRHAPGLRLVYLQGDEQLIAARVARRQDHFMPAALLHSQFALLEPPGADEQAWICAADAGVVANVESVMARLAPAPRSQP